MIVAIDATEYRKLLQRVGQLEAEVNRLKASAATGIPEPILKAFRGVLVGERKTFSARWGNGADSIEVRGMDSKRITQAIDTLVRAANPEQYAAWEAHS